MNTPRPTREVDPPAFEAARHPENTTEEQRLVAVPVGATVTLLPAVTPSALRGIAKGADTSNIRDRRP